MTAATDRYLIERMDDGTVNLCESQGGAWVTICRDISPEMAARRGFNLDAPSVRRVFAAS
jgi:hypothetical protein